jgi:glycosyltransferase involved in cell wall biosynthesis
MSTAMRVLHAIHDFLPRHRAGTEIYTHRLCLELQCRGLQVLVLSAEHDPSRPHGSLTWRSHGDLPVIELVNNWRFASFEETYSSPQIIGQLDHVLRAVQPDLLHIHSLLNLSLELPALARTHGIPSVATLHDYTLVCPSGGQRVRLDGQDRGDICREIDPALCAGCFSRSPFARQIALGRLQGDTLSYRGWLTRLARSLQRRLPRVVAALGRGAARTASPAPAPQEVQTRLDRVQRLFQTVERFVAPSAALAADFRRYGLPAEKLEIADYGFAPLPRRDMTNRTGRLRIGFVGTPVWHKGLHLLIDALRPLPAGRYELAVFGDLAIFPDYAADLHRQARGLPVRFAGPFGDERASEVYGQVDVLVVPSLWPENSPLVVHEAFMSGVPVVASRLGGLSGLIEHDRWGWLFDPRRPGELTAALRALVDRPDTLARWSAALPPVRSLEDDAAQWEVTYREVLGRPGSP